MIHRCPFCNIKIYEVINDDYPNLESYLCYECGFQTNVVLMNEKELYQEYQKLFMRTKDMLRPKKLPRPKRSPTEYQQRNKTTDDSTEQVNAIRVSDPSTP